MESIIQSFVDELKAKDSVVGIALFGSYARGEQRPNSDVDVLVVTTEGVWRDIEFRNGQAFEMVYASKKDTLDFYGKNPNDAVQLWKDAKIVYDPQGVMEEIHQFAQELERKGKERPDAQKLKHLRFDAEDKIRAIEYFKDKDRPTANLYLQILDNELLERCFDVHARWTPAPKQRLKYLRVELKDFGNLFDELYQEMDLDKRIEISKRIIQKLF
ncbi:nucleotidyltransferase domain-containing protein [Candidatus Uhrbacteria bacterium]|nr:nucleotidyltransferase domain-containing protein [Candidatus Uhrbacteria bacterium]